MSYSCLNVSSMLLLSESQKQQESWKNGPQVDPNLSIPLLMQNQVPQGFEDGDHISVDLRPESVSQERQENLEAVKHEGEYKSVLGMIKWKIVYPGSTTNVMMIPHITQLTLE